MAESQTLSLVSCAKTITLIAVSFSAITAHGVERWVAKSTTQAKNAGVTASIYTSIHAAVEAANSGEVIKVLPGTYGGFKIKDSIKLYAMKSKTEYVNPSLSSSHPRDQFPVTITGTNSETYGNIIVLTNGLTNVTIQGFRIVGGKNGIQAGGAMSGWNITKMCKSISIQGNLIHDQTDDGIKVHQCSGISIVGNQVVNFSKAPSEGDSQEHGIDFVAVGNSTIKNNVVDGNGKGIGLCVKGGSISVEISGNKISRVALAGLGAGEMGDDSSSFPSSRGKYFARYLLVKNNTVGGRGISVAKCNDCRIFSNTGTVVQNKSSTNLCLGTSCPTTIPTAAIVTTGSSLDMR